MKKSHYLSLQGSHPILSLRGSPPSYCHFEGAKGDREVPAKHEPPPLEYPNSPAQGVSKPRDFSRPYGPLEVTTISNP